MNVSTDIITPVFNQCNFTKQYLECMCQMDPAHYDIYVIDNNSTDNTAKVLEEFESFMDGKKAPKLHVETLGVNCGFACASNLGWSKGSGDITIFLNNDIKTVNPYWDEPIQRVLLDEYSLNDEVLVGPTGGYVDEKTYDFKYETGKPKDKINYMSGWCLAGRRQTFEHLRKETPGSPIGPFIEKFGTYFEDTYMGFLSSKVGIPKVIIPCPKIVHFGKMTSRTMNLNQMYHSAKAKFTMEMRILKGSL